MREPGLWEGPPPLSFDWDAFFAQDTHCSLCDHAALCPCAGHRNRRHHIHEAAQEAGLCPQEEKAGLSSSPNQAPSTSPRASLDRPADVSILHGEGLTPEAWDFAVTSCLPASSNSRQSTRRTTSVSLWWLSTATLEGGVTLHVPWSPGSPNLPHPATSVSKWLSASLRHSAVTPRVPFCDGFAWLPRGALLLHCKQMTGGLPGTTSAPTTGPSQGLTWSEGHGHHHDEDRTSPATGDVLPHLLSVPLLPLPLVFFCVCGLPPRPLSSGASHATATRRFLARTFYRALRFLPYSMSSSSTCSSSRASHSAESDFLGDSDAWNVILDCSFHQKVGVLFWGWN